MSAPEDRIIPLLKPCWFLRSHLNEFFDGFDNPYRLAVRVFSYGSAILVGFGRVISGSLIGGSISLAGSLFIAWLFARIAEPYIVARHDRNLPAPAVAVHAEMIRAVMLTMTVIRLFGAAFTGVAAGNYIASAAELGSLLLFQAGVVVLIDDGDRPNHARNFGFSS